MNEILKQFVKDKGFLVCDVQVAVHTQNCSENGLLKERLMTSATKLREKISQPTSTKQYNDFLFLSISNHYF